MLKEASSDLKRSRLISAVGMIFEYDEHWLNFFYSHKTRELRCAPEELIEESRCFSHGEQIKIKAALDLWTGNGYATLAEIIQILDWENFVRVIIAAMIIRDVSAADISELRSRYET